MTATVKIFGKNTWPYTTAAREAYTKQGKEVEYIDVFSANEKMDAMLKLSKGERKVPVIVDGESVTIGFNGGTWGVWSAAPVGVPKETSNLVFRIAASAVASFLQFWVLR